MTIAQRIKKWREHAGLTPSALASACRVSVPAVYYWEQGKTSPRHENIEKIALACGVTIPVFWSDPPRKQNRSS